jgi:hypothetical protein
MLVMFSTLRLRDEDAWIEDVRRRCDPQHRFVSAHVTFVFPFPEASTDDALALPTARRNLDRPVSGRGLGFV